MALRIARGLFRLWLVCSVLWVGGVATETWWTFPADELVAPPGAEPPGSDKFIDPYKPDPNDPYARPPFDPSKPYVVVRDEERRKAIQFASILAFVPPVFLLALGSALVWAFRGFRN
jgi:hypothetical protein